MSRNRNNNVSLTEEERQNLEALVSKGKASARAIRRAQILLLSDVGRREGKKTQVEIAEILGISTNTVSEVRKKYCEGGLETALTRKKRETPPIERKVTGDVEAKIIAISCSEPPSGRVGWTLKLIAERVVELEILDSIAPDTVRRVLKKTNSNRT